MQIATSLTVHIYRYSNSMWKYMPIDDIWKTFEKLLLFSSEQIPLFGNLNRKSDKVRTVAQRTNSNLTDIIKKFGESLEL